MTDSLLALSPLDGRYAAKVDALRPLASEFGLIRARVEVELAWLQHLASAPVITELPAFDAAQQQRLKRLLADFDAGDAAAIKGIERRTNHDVKAVEYFLREKLAQGEGALSARALEFIHFAATSEDINNLAWALITQRARDQVMLPALDAVIARLRTIAARHAGLAMLSRTHGQTASPTTLGKEFANVVARLNRQRSALAALPMPGKFNGAVGNYNAHVAAYPDIDWPAQSRAFVRSLGLDFQPLTTQIEPHDGLAEYADVFKRIGTILIDLARDVWGYISLGYFRQQLAAGEVGSSTMPHKVNPIDFENAEGNLGIAGALFEHFAAKLPISRFQRDLSDSTVLRALGTALGHHLVALDALGRGLDKLVADEARIGADLDAAPEVLAEAIQTVMRRYGLPEPYEQLKALTRGQGIDAETLATFIDGLALPDAERSRLRALTPAGYTGLAEQLARSDDL